MSRHIKPQGSGGKGGSPSAEVVSLQPRSILSGGRATRGTRTPREPAWTEVASFVINFECRTTAASGCTERRITAHKMQDGGITAEWTGLTQQPMVAWIADHVGAWEGVNVSTSETDATEGRVEVAPDLGDTSKLAVSIATIQIQRLGRDGSAVPTDALKGDLVVVLRSSDTFKLSAVIDISGLDEQEARTATPCTVQFFSRNTVTNERSLLGGAMADALLGTHVDAAADWQAAPVAGRASYVATLPKVTLPAGTYRLTSVATLNGTLPKLAHTQALVEVV